MRSGVYIVPIDRWYIERTVWLIAGVVLSIATALAALIDPRWVVLVIATGCASVLVSLTGFCIVGNALQLIGFRGRLARPGTRLYLMRTDSWYLERRIYLAVGSPSRASSAWRWSGSPRPASASWPTGCTGSAPSRVSRRRPIARVRPRAPPNPPRPE
jgi:hypothetical protein